MNLNKLITIIVKVFFIALVAYFFVWAFSNDMFSYVYEDSGKFFTLLKQHLTIVAISGGLAILISIPLGILLTRPKFQRAEWFVVNLANLGQTIPSLAVLALAMGILGIGIEAAIVALFVYSVLPILQNTIAGIYSVDSATKDAAKGMGLTPIQVLWQVELPSATYSIMAGVRTAIIINIGTAALAFLIGGGGLGVWIFTGISLFDNAYLLSGAVPVTLLAILTDFILRGIQYMAVPKGLRLAREAVKT